METARNFIYQAYDFNLTMARELVADVPEEMMARPGGPGLENHPAFTLGHLADAAGMTVDYLGGEYEAPEGWMELFRRKGPGDPRHPDPEASYPDKETLLVALERHHLEVKTLIGAKTEAELSAHVQWRFSDHLPTLFELLHFMCLTHEALHLGPLSGWRRAMGLESALGRIGRR